MLGSIPNKTKPTTVLVTGPNGTKMTTKVYQTQADGGDVVDAFDAKLKELGAECDWKSPKSRPRHK